MCKIIAHAASPRLAVTGASDHDMPLVGSSDPPPVLYNGDDALRLLQERDEAHALYSNTNRDLGQMHFHLNAMQDALSIFERDANIAWVKLSESEAKVAGKAFERNLSL